MIFNLLFIFSKQILPIMQKIFISGASGLIGGNCLHYFTQKGLDVIGTYFSYATTDTYYFNTLDLAHSDNYAIEAFKPDVIVHCGALTHVDYCETNEAESYQKTVQSTINLLEIAQKMNAKFVYISTDYVFDGAKGPYHEYDEVKPLSVYATHKWMAEQLVLNAAVKSLVLRVTNVYGNELRNKNFVARLIDQCKQQETLQLKLPYDQYATPVNAYDVARAMYLLLNDQHTGLFHIASTDFMNRVELAMRVLSYFPHAKYQLTSVSTETLQQPALRPLIAGLHKTKFSTLYPEFLFSSVDQYVQSVLRQND